METTTVTPVPIRYASETAKKFCSLYCFIALITFTGVNAVYQVFERFYCFFTAAIKALSRAQ